MAQPDTYESLLEAFRKDEKLMDRLERAVFSSADDYMESLSGALDDAISSLLTDAEGLVRPNKQNASIIREIENQIEDILESNGMDKARREILDVYQSRLDTVDDMVKNAGIKGLTEIDYQALPEINDQMNQFVDALDDATPEVGQIVKNEMLLFRNDLESGSAVGFRQLKNTLINKAGIMPRYAGTVGNTQLASLDRTARIVQADSVGIEKMKYMGVLDGLTRPFCKGQLGKVRPLEEWRKMQNNVNPQPVSKYCGGWNCRHRLIMWRDEWETQQNPSDGMVDSAVIDQAKDPLNTDFLTEASILLDDAPKYVAEGTDDFGNGNYYHAGKNEIHLVKIKALGKVDNQSIYHEYGHAAHFQNKIANPNAARSAQHKKYMDDVVNPMRDKFEQMLDKMDARERGKLSSFAMQKQWADMQPRSQALKKGLSRAQKEQGAFSDTIAALSDAGYGSGHSPQYFAQNNGLNKAMEVFAHGMSNRYRRNKWAHDNYPEFWSEFEQRFNKFVDELIETKQSD